MASPASSQQFQKPVQLQLGLFQYMAQRGAFHGAMGGNRKFQSALSRMFLKPDMASSLPDDHPPVPLESANNFPIRDDRDGVHRASSNTSACS